MISFDSLMLSSVITEFFNGARINKIQQPTRRELIFSLRNNGQTRQFYININPKFYHVCFMSEENLAKRHIEIPQKPPMFCMLLRKYLSNSRIARVNQPKNERILEIFVETYNEIGDKIYLCLAIELMGKYSNVILYNTDTNIILGCAHNVGSDKSQVREVYGTIPYTYPPAQDNSAFLNKRYGFIKKFNWTNDIIDNYYAKLIEADKFQNLKSQFNLLTRTNLKKVEKSLAKMQFQLDKSADCDKYRLYGDLIMANLYTLKDYSEFVKVYDYENDKEISVSLDPLKTLKENANSFYKKYNKSKTALLKLQELIEEQRHKKEYLDQVLYSINAAENIEELYEIEICPNPHPNPLPIGEGVIIINTDANSRIYVGKNNKQNDYIISKLAADDDLWFHVHNCAGAHVLLKTQNVTDELILECAKLAKQYSSAANSGKVGVIYTKRKYLRKPPKANLGYVTYKNEKEIIID